MESKIGIVRRIDDLGRVVIPLEIRKALKISEGDALEIFLTSEGVLIKRYDENTLDEAQIEALYEAKRLLNSVCENGKYNCHKGEVNINNLFEKILG